MFDWLLNDPEFVTAWGALKSALLLAIVGVLGAVARAVWTLTPVLLKAGLEWAQNQVNARLVEGGKNTVAVTALKLGDAASPATLQAAIPQMVEDMQKTFTSLQGAVDPAAAAERFVARGMAEQGVLPVLTPAAAVVPASLQKPVEMTGSQGVARNNPLLKPV